MRTIYITYNYNGRGKVSSWSGNGCSGDTQDLAITNTETDFIYWIIHDVCLGITSLDTVYLNGALYTTWIIQGEKGMTGTIELVPGTGLLWHITSPVQLNIYYGGPNAMPATYVDSQGRDQMAVIDSGQVALDQNYSGGFAEIWLPLSSVTMIDQGTGITKRIILPSCIQPTCSFAIE